MKALITNTAIAAAVLSMTATAMPAAAAEKQDIPTRAVDYNDLDLSTEQGMNELRERFDRAARDVCGMDERLVGSRLPSRQAKNCYREKRDAFESQIADVARSAQQKG